MATSCGFNRDRLVLHIVQWHQPRMRRAVFEVDRDRLVYIGPKFFPCFRFGEDGVAERTRAVATFAGVANFEDRLDADRIAEAGMDGGFAPARLQ